MKKTAENQANMKVDHKLDTVGVDSSILSGPTIKLKLDTSKSYVIPRDFEVIPAIDWNNGLPSLHLEIHPKPRKRRGKGVTFCNASSGSRRAG